MRICCEDSHLQSRGQPKTGFCWHLSFEVQKPNACLGVVCYNYSCWLRHLVYAPKHDRNSQVPPLLSLQSSHQNVRTKVKQINPSSNPNIRKWLLQKWSKIVDLSNSWGRNQAQWWTCIISTLRWRQDCEPQKCRCVWSTYTWDVRALLEASFLQIEIGFVPLEHPG